jgi:hypothetical protein
MELRFPELRGGPVQGLNDAGVENFQGAIDVYLSRECGQNTTDAHRPEIETVRLDFDRIHIKRSDIPGFEELGLTLRSCLERWGDKEKEREFFENALELWGETDIPVLKISDYGTTGLTGTDSNEKGRWFALVKSQGVSNKEDTAGGSFGIGKSSPFAASRFRTVFYGTRTTNDAVALQGVSRLVTHKNPGGKLTQGVGFIGQYDPDGGEGGEPIFRAVRDESSIPKIFRRTEAGTDIWVIGYRSGREWSANLISSILTNFWPAIHKGIIEFRVGSQKINKENVSQLIDDYSTKDEFETHHFFKAILNKPIEKKLNHVGYCELYLATSMTSELPRKVCMTRRTGMRIYDYQPRACRVPFAGLFMCTDTEGNKLLRKLEPPQHDTWDPNRIEDEQGKRALNEIKTWILEEVKKLNPLFMGKSFTENEMAKYLPDIEEDPHTPPDDELGKSNEESLEPRARIDQQTPTPIKPKPIKPKTSGSSPGDIGGGEDGGKTGKEGGSKGTRRPKNRGGAAEDEELPTLKARSYEIGKNSYKVILRTSAHFNGGVAIIAAGEDGEGEPVVITAASKLDESSLQYRVTGNVIHDVDLDAGQPLAISITLDAVDRRSLTAYLR